MDTVGQFSYRFLCAYWAFYRLCSSGKSPYVCDICVCTTEYKNKIIYIASICSVNRNFAAVKFKCAEATNLNVVLCVAHIFGYMLISFFSHSVCSSVGFDLYFGTRQTHWAIKSCAWTQLHIIHCVYEGYCVYDFIVPCLEYNKRKHMTNLCLLIQILAFTWEMRFYICKHHAFSPHQNRSQVLNRYVFMRRKSVFICLWK